MLEVFWKVKDGLFLGSRDATEDLELLAENTVRHIVNCAGFSVPNACESMGVRYLTYEWVDADRQVILDQNDTVVDKVFGFIEEALEQGDGVMIQSTNGQSRSCCIVVAYLMKRFRWAARKALDFLTFRRPEHKLQASFLRQLSEYERRLAAQSDIPLGSDWGHADMERGDDEALVMRNTYLNGQRGPADESLVRPVAASASRPSSRVVWRDDVVMSSDGAATLELPDSERCCEERNSDGSLVLRSALKGSKQLGVSMSTTADCLGTTAGGGVSIFDCSMSTSSTPVSLASPASAGPQRRHVSSPTRATPGLRPAVPQATSGSRGVKVARFFLSFEPPAMLVDWGRDPTRGSSDSAREPRTERTCTRMEFTDAELADVRVLAKRVLRKLPVLTSQHLHVVEALLKQLASRSLPVYRVTDLGGATLHYDLDGQRAGDEASSVLPSGSLVLARRTVRESDGSWMVRAWSGHWLTVSRPRAGGGDHAVAERCEPSPESALSWLRDAAKSQDAVLVQNATAVAKQLGLNPKAIPRRPSTSTS